MLWVSFKRLNLMLRINLLPWRDYARARQKIFFKKIALLTIMTSCIVCFLVYHHLKVEFHAIEKRIVRLTKESEKYVNKSGNTSVALRNIINKSRRNQDQLKKMLHAIFLYSAISWETIEIQKGVIKISGVVNLMNFLISFIDYCREKFNFIVVVKSIKIISPFDAVRFQVQIDMMTAELQKNGLA